MIQGMSALSDYLLFSAVV